MSRWTFVFQRDGLPVSVRREDGSAETPPPGLVRYIEIAHGAWTTSPASNPIATMLVDWPRACPRFRCPGPVNYVEHLSVQTSIEETGETIYPHGWKCETCGLEMGEFGGGAFSM